MTSSWRQNDFQERRFPTWRQPCRYLLIENQQAADLLEKFKQAALVMQLDSD